MLVSITNKCRMGCSHCMDDARADSEEFMTLEMFKKAIAFNFKYDFSLTITGGEPTEHPLFWDFMDIVADYASKTNVVSVISNGMNFSNEDIPKIRKLNQKSKATICWQITSDSRYYPIKIDLSQKVFRKCGFFVCEHIEKLDPMGRALNHPEWNFTQIAPHCFNFRSIVRTNGKEKGFAESVLMLRDMQKFCTPQISFDGMLKLGESTLCPAVCSIEESEKEIVSRIIDFRCSKCNRVLDKLPDAYKKAIGE